jgi:hypothetical protein
MWLLLRPDVSEERIAAVRLKIINELGTTLAVTSNCSTLRRFHTANVPTSLIFTLGMEEIRSSEMSVLTRATRRHIPEDDILRQKPSECTDRKVLTGTCSSTMAIKHGVCKEHKSAHS